MWFSKIHARAFGPMKNHGLEFKKGLNIVHGPNESGKSSWHAAITAALCGLRRGAGRTKAEREFEERHRPWDAGDDDPWFVQAGVMLDDGRHIEIDRDFDNRKTDVRRADLGGRAFTDLPMNDGSPDGSMLLGLDRETFPMTASVGQASIISDLDEPDALQQHLARAAAGGAGGTAAGALKQIEAYKREHVGLDRSNSTKPLRRAKNVVGEAEANLAVVERAHREYLDLVSALQVHRREVKRLTSERALAEAQWNSRAAKQEADRLGEAVEKLDKWERRFSDGDPSKHGLPDLTRLAQALGSVETLPASEVASLESADVIQTRLADIDTQDPGPCPDLDQVQRCVAALRERPASAAKASEVSAAAVGAAAVALAVCVAVGVITGLPYGVGLAMAFTVAGWWLIRGRRISSTEAHQSSSAALAEAVRTLDGWQLPHDPDDAVAEASRRLQARAAQSLSRQRLADELRQRREFDSAEARRRRSREEAWCEFRSQASGHGLDGTDDEVRSEVRALLAQDRRAQERHAENLEEWGRYQEALDGRSPQDWRDDAQDCQNAVKEMLRRLERLGVESQDAKFELVELEREIRRIDDALREARDGEKEVQGALSRVDADSVDVAAAEAQLIEAEAELTRAERLAATLDTTRDFLEAAAENAHQLLAPRLGKDMRPWIPKVTKGRYWEVQVDPGNLNVTLVTAAGDRRDARLVSRGTTEQVYLVLRLVLAQVLSADHEMCPVLLDDPTVHADATRKTEILNYLLEASKEHQVIVFSQEQEVLDWARKQPAGAVRLIELADPQPA